MTPPDPRLDELFVRYWDNTLTPAEADELDRWLAADPAARDWFQTLSVQAVAAAERPAVIREAVEAREAESDPPLVSSSHWSRRRVLGYLGGGLAAGLAGVVVGRRFWGESEPAAARLAGVRGAVTLRAPDGRHRPAVGGIAPGSRVATHGTGASVELVFPDGSGVILTENTEVTLADARRVEVNYGAVTADIRPQPEADDRLTVTTAQVSLTGPGGGLVTLGRTATATEAGVRQGELAAATAAGESLGVVRQGEVLTVREKGGHQKQPLPNAPDAYNLDLTEPLPDVWHVGRRAVADGVPLLNPAEYPDPYYHGTVMHQVRSDNRWTRGFFRLHPASTVRVKYRVRQPGPSQVCVVVRGENRKSSATGVLECNDAFAAARPGEWEWMVKSAAQMHQGNHIPTFGPPWVGFILIVNTYTTDLGLEVAEFRVDPPGG